MKSLCLDESSTESKADEFARDFLLLKVNAQVSVRQPTSPVVAQRSSISVRVFRRAQFQKPFFCERENS